MSRTANWPACSLAAAEVTLAALPGKTYKGRVREVSPAADPQSRTFRIKVTLEQPDASVRLGMTGEVRITPADTAQGQVLLLPATALFHQGGKPAVWIVGNEGKLELRR
jgi:multidrug efflux pump subunit AcrA (membrane-fusion protein)